VERLGSSCTGDVAGLVGAARAELGAVDDATLAGAFEGATQRRATAQDRTAAWWLACATATLRASPVASAQEDAEIIAARAMGELAHSPAARAPIPEGARWIVAGAAEPSVAAQTVELARRNARAHVERLSGELAGRGPVLRMQAEAARNDGAARATLEEALRSYDVALSSTRASLARAIDHLIARGADPATADAGASAMIEFDDVVARTLSDRVRDARKAIATPQVPGTSFELAATSVDEGARPSFAGAAPPSFRNQSQHGAQAIGSTAVAVVSAPAPAPAAAPGAAPGSREELDAQMRQAFERAWTTPGAETRAAFIQAVRARYVLETEMIPDPEERSRALDHYVAHAVAQLPPG
jgi:hypothetical protein